MAWVSGPPRAPHRGQRDLETVPGGRRHGIAGGAQQVAAIEEQSRVDVPGNRPRSSRRRHWGRATPGKKSARSIARDVASRASSGSSAPSTTSSGIQVLPTCTTSGIAPPTYAVSSFSCAALHGICWTRDAPAGMPPLELRHELAPRPRPRAPSPRGRTVPGARSARPQLAASRQSSGPSHLTEPPAPHTRRVAPSAPPQSRPRAPRLPRGGRRRHRDRTGPRGARRR